MKKIINMSLVLLIGIILLTGCANKIKDKKQDENNNDTKVNTNQDVIKDQTLENFKFENTSLVYENGNSVLETIVTNTSSETTYLKEFKIIVKDVSGNEIVTLKGFVGDSLGAGESRTITSSYGDDLTEAKSITYEVIR